MKKCFWDAVGIPFKIKSSGKNTLEESVSLAFKSSDFYFYGSCWFIDVKKRFRIFEYKHHNYVVKEVSEKKANLEITNSRIAHEKLEGKVIGTKIIRIVIPKKIVLPGENRRFFLISEYLGPDLNEDSYTNAASKLSLEDCLAMIWLLIQNGIAYRGYLPKNIVVKDGILSLFDWEDASFVNSSLPSSFDHLWRTQFLLNWSNLFNRIDLDKGLNKIEGIKFPPAEPILLGYEKAFKEIANLKASNAILRSEIDRIVFSAEKPLTSKHDHFSIHPYDMGCLVADIFSDEVDVLYDILSYVFRFYDEQRFCHHVEVMTHLLIEYHRTSGVEAIHNVSIQYYFLIPILMMLDEPLSNEEYEEILSTESLSELIAKICQLTSNQSVTKYYLMGNKTDLSQLLFSRLREKIVEVFPKAKPELSQSIDEIVTFTLRQSDSSKGQR